MLGIAQNVRSSEHTRSLNICCRSTCRSHSVHTRLKGLDRVHASYGRQLEWPVSPRYLSKICWSIILAPGSTTSPADWDIIIRPRLPSRKLGEFGLQPKHFCLVSIATGHRRAVQVVESSRTHVDDNTERYLFRHIKSFIPSVESFIPGWKTATSFPSGVIILFKMAETVSKLVIDLEHVHWRVCRGAHSVDVDKKFPYFRFNVERDVGDIGVEKGRGNGRTQYVISTRTECRRTQSELREIPDESAGAQTVCKINPYSDRRCQGSRPCRLEAFHGAIRKFVLRGDHGASERGFAVSGRILCRNQVLSLYIYIYAGPAYLCNPRRPCAVSRAGNGKSIPLLLITQPCDKRILSLSVKMTSSIRFLTDFGSRRPPGIIIEWNDGGRKSWSRTRPDVAKT